MSEPTITIIRSTKRRKTIQTKYADNHLWIYFPCGMPKAEEQKWVDKIVLKMQKRQQRQKSKTNDSWLWTRAQELNKRFFNGSLDFSIKFVPNQHSRFGSCTSVDKTIRISDRVASMPGWVKDYVILHELAHLLYPDHSKDFWGKVNEFAFAERAKGYLIAVGLEPDEATQK